MEIFANQRFKSFLLPSQKITRSGNLNDSTLYNYSTNGNMWSSTVRSESWGYNLEFNSGELNPANQNERNNGFPVRCVAR